MTGWPVPLMAAGKTDGQAPVASFAVCVDCGADIEAWRERLLPVVTGTLAITENGSLAVRVEHEGICDACGGGLAEIRVEAHPQGGSRH